MAEQSTYGGIVNKLNALKTKCYNSPDIDSGSCVYGSTTLPDSPDGRWVNDKTKLNAYNMNLINNAIQQLASHQAVLHNALIELIELLTHRNAGWQATNDDGLLDVKNVGTGEIFNDYEDNKAYGEYSHVEGKNCASNTRAKASHVEGIGTQSGCEAQHVQGRYNSIENITNYAHIVGGGLSNTNRKNIHTIDWDGNAMYKGNISIPPDKDIIVGGNKLYDTIKNNTIKIQNKLNAVDAVGKKDYLAGQLRGEVFNGDINKEHRATGVHSSARGLGTYAYATAQNVQGKYNQIGSPNDGLVHIVGWGTSDQLRKNIHTIDKDGNAWYSGDMYLHGQGKDQQAVRVPIIYSGTEVPSNDLGVDGDIYIMYEE